MDDHSLPAGTFKATCLKLMDEVAATGKSVTITKRGKPVARLVPVAAPKPKSFFGALAHCTHIVGDIVRDTGYSVDAQAAESIREWDEIEAGLRAKRPRKHGTRASRLRGA